MTDSVKRCDPEFKSTALAEAGQVLEQVQAQPRRFERYPTYKPSGAPWLGDIPESWQVKRLRFAAKINPTKSEIVGLSEDDVVSFVPMEAVHEYGGMTLEQDRPLGAVQQGYTYFRDGDIVAAKITPCFENGKGSIAAGLTNGVGFGTTELHVIRPDGELDRRFAFYLTLSDPFRKLGTGEMYGAGGQKRVPDAFIKDFRTPLPPLDEQHGIAAFLDHETAKIDGLVAKKRRLIELLTEKRTALISRAVTKGLNPAAPMKSSGINWIGNIPKHWDIKQLKRNGPVLRGASPRPIDSPEWFDDSGEFAWVRIEDVTASDDGYLRKTTQRLSLAGEVLSRKLLPGSLFLSMAGSVGKPCITAIRCCIHDGFVYFPFLHGKARYHYYMFHVPGIFGGLGKLGTQLNLNTQIIGDIHIPVPPLSEQIEIAAHIDNAGGKLSALVRRIDDAIGKLLEYRSALISAAVTGKIDVRGEVL